MEVVTAIEAVGSQGGETSKKVVIKASGVSYHEGQPEMKFGDKTTGSCCDKC